MDEDTEYQHQSEYSKYASTKNHRCLHQGYAAKKIREDFLAQKKSLSEKKSYSKIQIKLNRRLAVISETIRDARTPSDSSGGKNTTHPVFHRYCSENFGPQLPLFS